MGNGRGSERSVVESPARLRAAGAALLLLFAASVLLGLSSRHSSGSDISLAPGLRTPTPSRSFLSANTHAKPDARALLARLPLMFEPNQGQAEAGVKFLAQGAGYSLFLDSTGATLGMQTGRASKSGTNEHFVRMKLVGANPSVATTGDNPLPGHSNYLIGNDPRKWHRNIPQFGGVRYQNVYPGIDLIFYGKQGHLEYDFKVAPGADPSLAELQFDGATKLELRDGDLVLTGANDGGLRLQAPQIYQRDGDNRIAVSGRFALRADNRVGFEIGSYDRSRELVVDPILQFSTYFGGSGSETSPSVAVDLAGNIYLVGSTQGSPANTFPTIATPNLFPSTLSLSGSSPSHIFIARIAPSQPSVGYITFLGGMGSDNSVGVGVDGGGNAYIVGNTSSIDFPTGGIPYQTGPTKTQCTVSPTCTSVFVSVLNSLGSQLPYSSYVSGNGDDVATGMTIDSNQDVFITGTTTSNDVPSISPPDEFPASFLPVPFQTAPNAPLQFFVTEVNTKAPGISSIAYSTYFGGGPVNGGTVATGGGIAVDSTGNVYFSGTTNFFNSGSGQFGDSGQSGDFPILNAYQPCLDTPPPTTLSNPNPCTAPLTAPYPNDAFVAKLNPANAQKGAAQLLFSTFFGGALIDSSTGIALDPTGANIYITGTTNSIDFVLPTGSAPFQGCLNNPTAIVTSTSQCPATSANTDAYVARFSNPLTSTTGTPVNVGLTYFSYLGGSGNETGAAIAVDTASDAFLTGATNSTDFPVTTGAIQPTLVGTQNAFFAHINTTTTTSGLNGVGSYSTYFGGNSVDRGTSIVVDPTSLNAVFAGDTTSNQNLQTHNGLQTTLNGPRDAFVAELVPAAAVTVTPPTPGSIVSAGFPVTLTFTVTNQGPDLATGISVVGSVSSTGVTFTSATAGSGTCSTPSTNGVVCTIATLQAGATSSVVFSVIPSLPGSFQAIAQVIKLNNTNTSITASAPFTAGGFSMSALPSGATIPAGQIARYTVQLSPQPVFPSPISLTVSGLPSATTFNFTSNTITLGNGTQSTVLNVTTTPQPVTIANSGAWRGPLFALAVMLPGIALFGFGAGNKQRRRRWKGLLSVFVFLGMVLFQLSCSSSSKAQPPASGTPSGTYALMITGTAGSYSQSQPVQLTVTP